VAEWSDLASNLSTLLAPEVVDHLNSLYPEALRLVADDEDEAHFLRVFLARYIIRERPLSGYFIVCCIMETIWTVLAQTFSFPLSASFDTISNVDGEAAAANVAWARLMRKPVLELDISGTTAECLTQMVKQAMKCYMDLLAQIEDMDTDPSLDTYAFETMSESLVSDSMKAHERTVFRSITLCVKETCNCLLSCSPRAR
jgi:phosphatidylinositol 4-kinase